jgi:hypothetical protein
MTSSEKQEPPWRERRNVPDPQVLEAANQFDNARQLLDAQPAFSGVLYPMMNDE